MLKPSLLRFILRLMRRFELSGPLLTLGVQDVLLNHADALGLLQAEGFSPRPVPDSECRLTTSVLAKRHAGGDSWIHAKTFFRLCGITDYTDMDAALVEGPTLVHDLNQPVPSAWHERYRWVLDSGTTEHIFDVRTTLTNIAQLTQVGGYVMHISPLNGWANHGFFQLSPCLFFDFYGINGFEPVFSTLVSQIEAPGGGLRFSEYQYSAKRVDVSSSREMLFLFLARKVATTGEIILPIQSKYCDRMPSAARRKVS